MKASIIFLLALVIAFISINEAATVSNGRSTRGRANAFRHRSRQLRKRQFADNSQLINVEQNGNILELFSTTTNLASPRGRAASPNNAGDK